MFYTAFALIIYAIYAIFFIVGGLFILFGAAALRRNSFGWGRVITGIVLCLIPLAVIASSYLDPTARQGSPL